MLQSLLSRDLGGRERDDVGGREERNAGSVCGCQYSLRRRECRIEGGRSLGMVPLPGIFFIWLFFILLAYAARAQMVKTWLVRRFGYH